METIDWIELIIALVFLTIGLILWRRNKSKPKMWPCIFGIWGGVYTFVLFMTISIIRRPTTELIDYTTENFVWSLGLGIWAYFCGRVLVRRMPAKE